MSERVRFFGIIGFLFIVLCIAGTCEYDAAVEYEQYKREAYHFAYQ